MFSCFPQADCSGASLERLHHVLGHGEGLTVLLDYMDKGSKKVSIRQIAVNLG